MLQKKIKERIKVGDDVVIMNPSNTAPVFVFDSDNHILKPDPFRWNPCILRRGIVEDISKTQVKINGEYHYYWDIIKI